MKLIKPSFEIIEQQVGLIGIYKQIELAGRICYKSEDKITDDSAKEFVDKMIKSNHTAMLEHGTVYLYLYETSESSSKDFEEVYNIVKKYEINPFSKVSKAGIGTLVEHKNSFYITTNYRVIVENNWLDDLRYLCEPTEYHKKRHSVKFIADAGVMREFFRHRVFSMAQESTRYCNYSNSKFGKELTFIAPPWIDVDKYDFEYGVPFGELPVMRPRVDDTWGMEHYTFFYGLQHCEEYYFKLLELGWKPQQARVVLPLNIKAEGIMTGFASDWEHFFSLRAIGTTGAPHPQAKELAEPLMNEFINRKYI
jgi:thymidylate synthase (FAD)